MGRATQRNQMLRLDTYRPKALGMVGLWLQIDSRSRGRPSPSSLEAATRTPLSPPTLDCCFRSDFGLIRFKRTWGLRPRGLAVRRSRRSQKREEAVQGRIRHSCHLRSCRRYVRPIPFRARRRSWAEPGKNRPPADASGEVLGWVGPPSPKSPSAQGRSLPPSRHQQNCKTAGDPGSSSIQSPIAAAFGKGRWRRGIVFATSGREPSPWRVG